MNLKSLPKIELHCHLDGSARPETLFEIAKEISAPNLPIDNFEEFEKLTRVPCGCCTLDEYLTVFNKVLPLMQEPKNLYRIAGEILEDAHRDNVKYIEIRFAPHLHQNNGASLEAIIESVIAARNEAKQKFGIESNIILCTLSFFDPEKTEELVDVGSKYLGNGLVALDIAGPEVAEMHLKHKAAFRRAKSLGFGITAHGGEVPNSTAVEVVVNDLGAERIGHGIHVEAFPEVYKTVKEKGIALETCPTSNVQTGAVVSIEKHPIKRYMEDGIKVTVSTDNRTVSDTTMTGEYKVLRETFSFKTEDYKILYSNSASASFASEKVKKKIGEYILNIEEREL